MTWRTGKKVFRTIYDGEDGHYVGQMFTPALAARVVEAVNVASGTETVVEAARKFLAARGDDNASFMALKESVASLDAAPSQAVGDTNYWLGVTDERNALQMRVYELEAESDAARAEVEQMRARIAALEAVAIAARTIRPFLGTGGSELEKWGEHGVALHGLHAAIDALDGGR